MICYIPNGGPARRFIQRCAGFLSTTGYVAEQQHIPTRPLSCWYRDRPHTRPFPHRRHDLSSSVPSRSPLGFRPQSSTARRTKTNAPGYRLYLPGLSNAQARSRRSHRCTQWNRRTQGQGVDFAGQRKDRGCGTWAQAYLAPILLCSDGCRSGYLDQISTTRIALHLCAMAPSRPLFL